MERLVVLASNSVVRLQDLPQELTGSVMAAVREQGKSQPGYPEGTEKVLKTLKEFRGGADSGY